MTSPKARRDGGSRARDRAAAGEPDPAAAKPSGPEIVAGRYVVEGRLGAGGLGTVVLATDRNERRRVALKRMDADLARLPQAADRMLRGARLWRSFSGKHIARVLDAGMLDGGIPFVVTEYLEGCNAAAYVERRGPLPIKEAVKYLIQICEAVAEAHAAGTLHRDLKPSNVFLAFVADGAPSVKVLDVGVSAVACGVESEGRNAASGAMQSSLQYMAPEQMRSAGAADERADIWSIGAVGYAMVCGWGPFDGPTEIEVCAKVLNDDPAPIPARLALGGVENVLLRCLEKDPAQRYANVSELALALARYGAAGAQDAAERVWEILRTDETMRMEAPSLDSAPGDAAPDTVPGVPDLFAGEPRSDATAALGRGRTHGAPTAHSEDTLVSHHTVTPDRGSRRGRAAVPEVVLLDAPAIPRAELEPPATRQVEIETERRPVRAARGADHDAAPAAATARPPPVRSAPKATRAVPSDAVVPAEARPEGAPRWRRPLEGVVAVVLVAGLLAVWLVRGRVIHVGPPSAEAKSGVALRAARVVRAGIDAWQARREGLHAAPALRSDAPAADVPSAASGRPPLVPPPGGWRYDTPPPESIYDEVERERLRRQRPQQPSGPTQP